MLGWSIRARAWRSASKRDRTVRESMPALMSLTATLRRTGSRLLGHPDGPHAPFADLFEQLVAAGQHLSTNLRRLAHAVRRVIIGGKPVSGSPFEKAAGLLLPGQQRLQAFP